MQYSKDFVARYISADNHEKIKQILEILENLNIDDILEQIARLWIADAGQQELIDRLRTQVNNVSLLYCTIEEYNGFSVKPNSTLYIVLNNDNTLSLYAGDTLITGGGGTGDVNVVELSRAEYNNLEEYDINTIYIVSENGNVSIYIGQYEVSGGGDLTELIARVTAIENQIDHTNLLSLSREEYDNLPIHENNTLYLVQDYDFTMKLYIGDTLINSEGGGLGNIIGIPTLIIQILGGKGLVIPFIVGIPTEIQTD